MFRRYQDGPRSMEIIAAGAGYVVSFDYVKWKERQHCKGGDWIVRNGDDTYTVDADLFARIYERVGPVEYRKVGTVRAEQAKSDAAHVDRVEHGTRASEAGDGQKELVAAHDSADAPRR